MAITRVGSGTALAGTGGLTPAYPAGVAAGRVAVLKATLKPDTGTISTPTGYTPFPGTAGTGGTGTQGADTGAMRVALFYRVLDGGESGTVTVSFTGNNNGFAVIDIYAADGGFDTASFAGTTGGDATHGTAWSSTGAANLSLAAGDLLVAATACTSNASNNLGISSRSVTAAGATFGALADVALSLTNSGNDSSLDWWDAPVTAGPSSAAPTYTATHSANDSGVTAFARLVEDTTVAVTGATSGNSFGFAGLAAGLPASPGRVRDVDFNTAGDTSAAFGTVEMVSPPDNTITLSESGGEGVFAATAAGAVGVNDRRLYLFDSAFQPANVDVLGRFGRVVGAPGDTQRGFVARVKQADASLGQAPIFWTNVIFGADGNGITGVWEWPTALNVLHTNQTGGSSLYGPDATVVGAGGTVTVTTTVPHLLANSHIIQVVSPGLSLDVQVAAAITVVDDYTFTFSNATTGSSTGYFRWLFTPPGVRTWMRMRLHANVITAKYWMDGHAEPADGDTLRTTTTTLATTLLSGAALRTGGGRVGYVVAHMGKDSQVLVDNFSAVDLAVRAAAAGSFGGTFTAAGTSRTYGTGAGAFGGTFSAVGVGRSTGTASGSFGGSLAASGVGRSAATATGAFGGVLAAAGVGRARGTATGGFGGTLTAAGVGRAVAAATGSFGGTLTAAGVRRTAGTGAGQYAATFTATGVSTAVGTAAASFGATFTATGAPGRHGTATGTFGFAGAAQGVGRAYGAATGAFGFAAAATGSSAGVVVGVATGQYGGTLAAVAVSRAYGTAGAAFGATFTAVAVAVTHGAASGAFGGALTATGTRRVHAAAAASLGFTATATGDSQGVAQGQAAATFGFVATVTAVTVRYGTAVGALGFVALALGRLTTGPTIVATHGTTRRRHTVGEDRRHTTVGTTRRTT